jgi:hypothetical protein
MNVRILAPFLMPIAVGGALVVIPAILPGTRNDLGFVLEVIILLLVLGGILFGSLKACESNGAFAVQALVTAYLAITASLPNIIASSLGGIVFAQFWFLAALVAIVLMLLLALALVVSQFRAA